MAQREEVVVPEGGSSGSIRVEITLKPLTKRSYRKAQTMSKIESALVKRRQKRRNAEIEYCER